jgi:hypothetical protein
MADFPLPKTLELMDMPFEMFQEFFKHIRNWAMLHQVCNLLRAHIKRAIDTPTGSTLKAHYTLDATRFNNSSKLIKPGEMHGALAEIQLYCKLYQLTSLTVNYVVPAEQFYTFGEMLAQNTVHLTRLNLSDTRLVIERLQPLSRLTNLTDLNMSFNRCLANAQRLLALPPNLRTFAINNCGLRGLGVWTEQVTGLTDLKISGNVFGGDDGGFIWRQMSKLPLLQKLELRNSALELQPLAAILEKVSTLPQECLQLITPVRTDMVPCSVPFHTLTVGGRPPGLAAG